jgi:hypothetical protein
MTTDVSRRPRAGLESATGRRILSGVSIEVVAEALRIDRWSPGEHCRSRFRADEPVASERHQLADRDTGTSHDERLTAIDSTHDLAAVVTKLPLSDLTTHPSSVAPRATSAPALTRSSVTRQMMRRSFAHRASSCRLVNCNLRSTADACDSTVLIEIDSSRAISL